MSDQVVVSRFPFDTPPELDDQPLAAAVAARGPMCRARLADGAEVWLAMGYDVARTAFADPRFSRAAAARPGAPSVVPGVQQPDLLVNMDPPDHSRVRRLVAREFTPQATERRRPRIQEITGSLLDVLLAQGPPADLVAGLALPLPITVVCDLLGVPYDQVDRVRGWVEIMLSTGAWPIEEILQAAGDLHGYITGLVQAKRGRPGDDLLTALIAVRDEGDRLTESELVMLANIVIVGGHETTANQMANSLLTLFRHPDQLELLLARPELVPGAVEELLRYTSLTSASLGRIATDDIEMGGETVRAGEAVFPLHYVANRDGRVFPDPDRLDVTRRDVAHLSFGAGPHLCLGAPLARLELQVALGEMLRRLPGLALAVPESELEWRQGTGVRGVRALPVTWRA